MRFFAPESKLGRRGTTAVFTLIEMACRMLDSGFSRE
jgi:hypothetical protein